jgi:hypothetical protein
VHFACTARCVERRIVKRLALSLILVVAACGAQRTSAAARSHGVQQITVRIHNYAQVESSVLLKSERTTDEILSEAGLQVVWLDCWARQVPANEPVCGSPMGPADLILNLLPQSMSRRFDLRIGALGVALEEAGGGLAFDAWIFCDLVKDTAAHGHLTHARFRKKRNTWRAARPPTNPCPTNVSA